MTFVELLRSKGVVVRENHSHQSEIWICCPFCADRGESVDVRFRLGVNLETDRARCFNCEWRSREATKWIARKLGEVGFVSDAVRRDVEETPAAVSLPEGFQLLARVDDNNDPAFGLARQYVDSRGIPTWQLRKWAVGATLLGRFAYRIIFPIVENKQLVGLVGRDWTGRQEPKYLNTRGIKTIYGDVEGKYAVVLVEGILKALAVERAMVTGKLFSDWGVAALLGHTVTDRQLEKLKDVKELVIMGDPDRPGILGGLRIAALASAGWKVSLVWPWPVKQADEMREMAIRDSLLTRKPWSRSVALETRWQALRR